MNFAWYSSPKCNDIIYGLPSLQIKRGATTLVIQHPRESTFIVLKNRLPVWETIRLKENEFVEINERRSWDADWTDIRGKHVIISPSILSSHNQIAWVNIDDNQIKKGVNEMQYLRSMKVMEYKYDSEEEAQRHEALMKEKGWRVKSNKNYFIKYFRSYTCEM